MRRIVVVSKELSSDGWFDKLSKKDQQTYIKQHPTSKYAKNVKTKDAKTPAKAPVKPSVQLDTQAIKKITSEINAIDKQCYKTFNTTKLMELYARADKLKKNLELLKKGKQPKEIAPIAKKEVAPKKETVKMVSVNPSNTGTKDYPGVASRIRGAAENGDRVVVNGKTVWAGLGNRSGLHSYAEELCREKWAKSGPRFKKSLDSILYSGATVEIQMYKNIDRDRGKWVTQWKTQLKDK